MASQLKQCLKKWAEGDFKTDSQLSLIPALYNRLKQEGTDFSGTNEPVSDPQLAMYRHLSSKHFLGSQVKKTVSHGKDVAAKEEEDLAKGKMKHWCSQITSFH